MASQYWLGQAEAVAQVTTIQVTAVDGTPANNQFGIRVGDASGAHIEIEVTGDTNVNTTAAALSTAWNNSTHLYCTTVTASVATDTVTLTADTAGVPFTVASYVSGAGTGTIGAATEATAATGPAHWDNKDNWSTGAVPVSSDDVYFANNSQPVLFGLSQDTIDINDFFIYDTYTGVIGLRPDALTTAPDGSVDSSAAEYRQMYLHLDTITECRIGYSNGFSIGTGSSRINIQTDAGAQDYYIHKTAGVGSPSNIAAVNLKPGNSTSDCFVTILEARGGVALSGLIPNDGGSTVEDLYVAASAGNSPVLIGASCVLDDSYIYAGKITYLSPTSSSGTAKSSIAQYGGTIDVIGDVGIDTLNIYGGTFNMKNDRGGASSDVDDINHYGGTINANWDKKTKHVATYTFYGNDQCVLIGGENWSAASTSVVGAPSAFRVTYEAI